MSVLLPEPFRPRMVTNSPRSSENEMPPMTGPFPYPADRFLTSRIGMCSRSTLSISHLGPAGLGFRSPPNPPFQKGGSKTRAKRARFRSPVLLTRRGVASMINR